MGKTWEYMRYGMSKDKFDKLMVEEERKAEIKREWKRTHTCKGCEKVFSEGYPYQKTIFGKTKNYVCKSCAKKLRLI